MRRENPKLVEDMKAKRKEKLATNIDLAVLDTMSSRNHYKPELVKVVAQFLATASGVDDIVEVAVLSGSTSLNQLENTLKTNTSKKSFAFLLELGGGSSGAERKWTTLVINKRRADANIVLAFYADPTGGELSGEVMSTVRENFRGKRIDYVEKLDGNCRLSDSGILSLKWAGIGMESLVHDNPQMYISQHSEWSKNVDVGKLKTDMKVDLVEHTVSRMLAEANVSVATKAIIERSIDLCNANYDNLGQPVSDYVSVMKAEMEKLDLDPNYKMDEAAITKAQKAVTGKLYVKEVDMVGLKKFLDDAQPPAEGEKETPESKERSESIQVFQRCVRMLQGTEETENLGKLLNQIGDKFGVKKDALRKYFRAKPMDEVLTNVDNDENLVEDIGTLPEYSQAKATAPDDPGVKLLPQLLAELAEARELSNEVAEDMDEFFRGKYIANDVVVQMKADFETVIGHLENRWQDADVQAINTWANSVRGSSDWSVLEGVAVMVRVFQLTHGGYTLRRTSILSAIWFLRDSGAEEGKLAQIGTGEGKTVIIGCVASIRVLQNHVVDVLTSNEVLAQDGVDELRQFYGMLGVSMATNNPDKTADKESFEGKKAKRCYSADVVYGTITNFQFDYLRHTSEGQNTRGQRRFDYVMLDEVDNLTVDNGGNIAKLAKPFPGMECLKYVYIKVWEELVEGERDVGEEFSRRLEEKREELELEEMGMGDEEEEEEGEGGSPEEKKWEEYEQFRIHLVTGYTAELRRRIVASNPCGIELIHPHLREFAGSMLERWMDNALFARFECRENEMYVVKAKKGNGEEVGAEDVIIPVDYSNTGVTMQNTQWSNGLHQFVQLKHNLQLTCESLTSSFISNIGYIKLYSSSKILGLTGTLGSTAEADMLRTAYNVGFIVMPRFKKYKLMLSEGAVVRDEMWANYVSLEGLVVAVARRRAVLLICKTIKELRIIEENVKACLKLEGLEGQVKLKTYVDEDGAKVVKGKVGPKEIIVATNIAGRGTNFKTTKELELAGGLHVVVAFLPYNRRVQDQAFGRTARQGNKGTAQLMLKESDIVDIGLDAEGTTMDKILEKRDELERERLGKIKSEKLAEINFNDELFAKFAELGREFDRKYEESPGVAFVAADLKELWAFWLHKQNYNFEKIRGTTVAAEFERFSLEARELTENCKVIWNPFNEVRRGERYFQRGKLEEAEASVKRAIEMEGEDSLIPSGYFKLFEIEIEKGGQLMERFKKALASLIFITLKKDEAYKEKAKQALEKTVVGLQKEVDYIKRNFAEEETNDDFQLILVRTRKVCEEEEKNVMTEHISARLTALDTFLQHAQSLHKRLTESVDSDTVGVAMGSRVPHYLKKLDASKPDEKNLKEALKREELDELQWIGLETIYSLRDVHDAHKETIIGAQVQIGLGLASLAAGLIFLPALPVLGPIAGALISEGICDIVIELISRGQAGFDVAAYVKGKCISFGIALATMGISAIATSTKLMGAASKACKSLATLLRKCPILQGVCEKLATQLDKLATFFEKLQLAAKFAKMKDLDKLEMLKELKAAGEVTKLKELGGLEKLRQLERLQDVGKLSRLQLASTALLQIGKQTVMSVTMSVISEKLVTAALDRILDGLRPLIETRVREGLATEKVEEEVRKVTGGRKEVQQLVVKVLSGSYGQVAGEVLQEIALGVARHCGNWKVKVASLALDAALSLVKILTYTSSFSGKFREAVVLWRQEGNRAEEADAAVVNTEKMEVVVSLVTNKIYALIMQLTGKFANTLVVAPLMKKIMGGRREGEGEEKKKKKSAAVEEDEQTLAQISDAYKTLNLSPGATEAELRQAYKQGALSSHPDKNDGADSSSFVKVRQAYELILKLHEDVKAGSGLGGGGGRWTREDSNVPMGLVTFGNDLGGGGIAPAKVAKQEPGDGGNVATLSSRFEQTIVVKCFDEKGLLVKEKVFGEKFRENGNPAAVIGFFPPSAMNRGVGHFFEMKGGESSAESSVLLKKPTTTVGGGGDNDCLYESLIGQIRSNSTMTVPDLRIVGESASLANFSYAVGNLAAQLLRNPLTRSLYVRARRALLVGGILEEGRDFRDSFVETIRGLNLAQPERSMISLSEACGDDKALEKIKSNSTDGLARVKSKNPDIPLYTFSGVDSWASFILNFEYDPNGQMPFVVEYPSGVRSVFAGNLYSLVAYKRGDSKEPFIAPDQYHGTNLGTVHGGMMALTDPQTTTDTITYPELSGRLISESIRNKATFVSTILAINCDMDSPVAGDVVALTSLPHLPVTSSTGIIWEESDVVGTKNPVHMLQLHETNARTNANFLQILARCVRTISGEWFDTVTPHRLRNRWEAMRQTKQLKCENLVRVKLYENMKYLLDGKEPPQDPPNWHKPLDIV